MDPDLLSAAGVSPSLFEKIVYPGTVVGTLTESLGRETGVGPVPVVAVAGHDTASAVAAVPTTDRNFAYLSSGTWSLMGIETDEPIISEESFQENFTNEGGIDGTIRFLKNITGMWLLERCREEWKREGNDYSYAELLSLMEKATPFRNLVNPNAPCSQIPWICEMLFVSIVRKTVSKSLLQWVSMSGVSLKAWLLVTVKYLAFWNTSLHFLFIGYTLSVEEQRMIS